MKKILGVLFVIFLISCNKEDKKEKEIANIPVNVTVNRFDKAFANATPKDLPKLKSTYPYLFPKQYTDSVWVTKMNDTLQQEINNEVEKKFSNFSTEKEAFKKLFQHIKFYNESFHSPKIVTLTNEVDYRNNVIYADGLLLIALDNYLGSQHKFYEVIPAYIAQNFEPSHMVVDAAEQIGWSMVPSNSERTFLSKIVQYGKNLYLKELFVPSKSEAEIMGYTQDKLNWTHANEDYIWRYFIEHKLLFSTDNELDERFLNLAPFSKFNLELDPDSPGMLGRYIGWQIVKAYMKNNDVSLQQMLEMPAEEIFNKSMYKPRK
ncbi:gliding motility lipoprotein GldB [Zhouia sp. PK063]|uniref:gliding motility lipoprotein GldB n=1 Tax=Zhouia sp. PK063 TaxID=3373602 RepID=UPI0037BE18E8